MTETTTKPADETVVGPDVHRGGEIATTPAVQGADVAAVPANLGDFKTAVRRMLGLEDASEGEIELFFHVCQKSGLDPFNKEVYMIGRNTEVAFYVPVNANEPDGQKRKEMRWVTKYTIQTAINGFRKRAREIADLKGIQYAQGDAQWCGEDGVWKEVWPESKVPVAAKFTVFRDGQPYSFVAHYSEYVQLSGNPKTPNSMWSKMPRNQLRKCAEAGAIQAAFPDELGGLLLEDAAQANIIDSDGNSVATPVRREPQRARGVAALAERVAPQQSTPLQEQETLVGTGDTNEADTEVENTTAGADQDSALRKTVRDQLNKDIAAAFKNTGLVGDEKRDDRLIVVRAIVGRDDIEDAGEISDDERQKLRNELIELHKAGALDAKVNDWLNLAALKEAEAAEAEQAEK